MHTHTETLPQGGADAAPLALVSSHMRAITWPPCSVCAHSFGLLACGQCWFCSCTGLLLLISMCSCCSHVGLQLYGVTAANFNVFMLFTCWFVTVRTLTEFGNCQCVGTSLSELGLVTVRTLAEFGYAQALSGYADQLFIRCSYVVTVDLVTVRTCQQ